MDWSISLSRQAEKFLKQHHLADEVVIEAIQKALCKFEGEPVAVDLRRLSGIWAGHFRVRVGKIRMIFSLNFPEHQVLVEIIDNRDRVYK
jgi:mRNA-degrading endonuclease RelE of RelBE toxin-antitoxin system